MAINAAAGWYVRAGGAETNGGGFDHTLCNYSAVAQTLTLSAMDGEGVTATAGGGTPFASGDVGKIIKDTTSGSIGFAQITAFTSSTVVTVRVICPFLGISIASNAWSLSAEINYADQDSPQLSLTDLVSTASTTVTSAAGLFTAAMPGNVIRLASATGSPVADSAGSRYLAIVTYVNATTVTVDKTSGTYTLGVAKLGGAHADLRNMSNGGGATAPALTSPLVAGNTIWARGAGSDNPSSADYTQASYYQFVNGSAGAGMITLRGYNGRPHFSIDGLSIYSVDYWRITHMKYKYSAANFATFGGIYMLSTSVLDDVYVDANGQDTIGMTGAVVRNCLFYNTGSASAGTVGNAAINLPGSIGSAVAGCFIDSWRAEGIATIQSVVIQIRNNVIVNVAKTGILVAGGGSAYNMRIENNTVHAAGLDCCKVPGADANVTVINNTFTGSVAGYGLNLAAGTQVLNDRLLLSRIDYNNYGTGGTANASGARNGISAGMHDLAVDPQFTNSAGGDYSVGTNLKALGLPHTFPGGTTTSYVDIGGAQRQESGGGTTTNIFCVMD